MPSAGLLADLVVLFHFGFVLFAVFGALIALRWPAVAWIHVPAMAWAALVEFTGSICPLTPLEQWLRVQAGEAAYAGGFIEHYVLPVLYPAGLTRGVQVVLGTALLAFNAAVYWGVWRRHRRRRP